MKNGNLSAPFKSSSRRNAGNFKGAKYSDNLDRQMPKQVSWSKEDWPPAGRKGTTPQELRWTGWEKWGGVNN